MRKFFLCLLLYLSLAVSTIPHTSIVLSQTLVEQFKSGKIHIAREAVFKEEDFGSEVYFQNPRGIAVDKNGKIYVSDASANDIKVIGPEGKLIQVIGQEGQGPGDFASPSFICIAKDKLIVWETMNRRFSILDLNGKFIQSVKMSEDWGWPLKLRSLPDGRVCVMTESQVEIDKKLTQWYRLFLLSQELELEKILYSRKLQKRKLIQEPMRVYVPQPFTPAIHWDVTPDGRIVIGCSETYSIEVYDTQGERDISISHAYSPIKITDEDKEQHFANLIMTVFVGNKRETKQGAPDYIIENTDFPKFKPAYSEIAVDEEGNIWVKTFEEEKDQKAYMFDIFSREGLFISKVTVVGETSFPSMLTSDMNQGSFWEVEKVDEEYFQIVLKVIGN